MSEWRELKLGELVNRGLAETRTGPFGTQLHASDYTAHGTPVINVRNLGFGDIRAAALERVGVDVQERLAQHVLVDGDVVFGRKGAVDRHALVTGRESGWMQGSDCIRFRLFPGSPIVSRFLSRALLTHRHRAWIDAQCSHGSTMASLNQEIISRIAIRTPTISTQLRIVSVLDAFDKVIEINEQRIALLEGLARSLYREWFVHFRFPGHEDVEFVDSELGRIPDGWEVRSSEAVLTPLGGGTPSKKRADYWNGGLIPWFTPTDLTRSRVRYVADSQSQITTLGLKESGARMFPAGSVLMTSRATLGVLAIATKESTCNQGFIVIPPVDGIPSEFIYEWLANHETRLAAIATGATFREITKAAFKRFPFLLPTRPVLAMFAEAVGPVGEQISGYERGNRVLAATRDLLLPRLVTGRLDISDIDLGGLLTADAA